jgi:hypothetical protein
MYTREEIVEIAKQLGLDHTNERVLQRLYHHYTVVAV